MSGIYEQTEKIQRYERDPVHWDSFEDNLNRIRRIKDEDRLSQNVYSLIQDTYKYLLNERLPVNKTYEMIVDKIIQRAPTINLDRSNCLDTIVSRIAELNASDQSHQVIDNEIIKVISQFLIKEFNAIN